MAIFRNGNIRTLQRGNENGTLIDNLSYQYQNGNNQLSGLSDTASPTAFKWDAENVSRFVYDANGNLKCDTALSTNPTCGANIYKTDPLNAIVYDDRDLPLSLQKDGNSIWYRYNAAGQRIYKKVLYQITGMKYQITSRNILIPVI